MTNGLNATAAFAYEAPGKPPMRVLVGELRLTNASPEAAYFVLPYFLDEPALEQSDRVEAVEVFKASSRGGIYFAIHRHPACYVFPVEPGASLTFPSWRFMTWSDKLECSVRAARSVVLNGSVPLLQWVSEQKLEDLGDPSDEHPLLATWEPEEKASLSVRDVIVEFPIRLSRA
ncbi:MAG: hypothetical protein ACK5X3_14095 [Pseudomonadota bacterium]|jgi:hypothetical protein|nr:hypothetical protein [Betaproteobacteria bacterium]